MSTSSAFQTLLFEKRGAVAHISLDRPQVVNAYNIQMRDDFSEALSAVAQDPDARALLITGEGRGFCAGADLTEFGSAPSQVISRQVRWERDVWGQLMALSQPVIAAVHGYCIGSGLEIALLCDVRIAAEDTVFAMPETQLGMIPAAGGTQTLPRNIGEPAALDLLLTGRRLDAAEALRLGLVTRVVPGDQLRDAAGRLAAQMAARDGDRMAEVKAAIREGMDQELDRSMEMESRRAILLADKG